MSSNEIEQYLADTFDKGVKVSRVHRGKLRQLNELIDQLGRSPEFFEWKDTRGFLYDLNNSLDQCLRLSKRWLPLMILSHPSNLGTWHSVRSSLKELKKKLDEYPKESSTSSSSTRANVVDRPDQTAVEEARNVHGFMGELVAVERLVVPCEQDGFKAVGIAGNAGVGKTTLCKELLKRQAVKDLYVPRIYVHLKENEKEEENDKKEQVVDEEVVPPRNENEKKVLKLILENLGVEKTMIEKIEKEHNVNGLACAVYSQLLGKKYLIVLDNVTSGADWYKDLPAKLSTEDPKWGTRLAFALPKGSGGTVLVTSRRLRLVNNMVKVDANVHRLVPRADKDFVLKIFKDSVDKQGLQVDQPVEKEIIKKCAGFPLAAKTMGKIMQEIDTLKELIKEPPPKEESTENTPMEEPRPPVTSIKNKSSERRSKSSKSEIEEEGEEHPEGEDLPEGSQEEDEEEQPRRSQEDEEDEGAD